MIQILLNFLKFINLFNACCRLSGVILSYKNPKLLSPLGYILYDTCYIHVDVQADFYIFRPEIGKSLKGKLISSY